jgi:hypothetical protein
MAKRFVTAREFITIAVQVLSATKAPLNDAWGLNASGTLSDHLAIVNLKKFVDSPAHALTFGVSHNLISILSSY